MVTLIATQYKTIAYKIINYIGHTLLKNKSTTQIDILHPPKNSLISANILYKKVYRKEFEYYLGFSAEIPLA